MKFQLTAFILTAILAPLVLCGKKTEATWRKLLKDHADCVTWVSATVRVEVSAGGRSMPPQEQKLEALGTIIAEDGLTVLSLSRVDPTATLLSRIRTPGGSVTPTTRKFFSHAGWDGSARQVVAQGHRPGLGLRLPIKEKGEKHEKRTFHTPPSSKTKDPLPLDEVVSLGKLGETSTDNRL